MANRVQPLLDERHETNAAFSERCGKILWRDLVFYAA